MQVAVLGAGVVGVTTAYYLAQQGHAVTVIDQAKKVASGTSHANGGQLSYSFTDALARPEFLGRIPALMLGSDPGIKVKLNAGHGMFGWGIDFLRQCTSHRANANTLAVLQQAMRSADLMAQLRDAVPIDFAFEAAGKLVMLSSDDQLEAAKRGRDFKHEHGCETQILTIAEASEIEPALAAMDGAYIGAVYSKDDHVGDARAFTENLRVWLDHNADVTFMLGGRIDRIVTENGEFLAVKMRSGTREFDAAIACLGVWSPELLRPLKINQQIYPVRGYSVTLPPGPDAPAVSVTDLGRRLLLSRLDGNMRLAGFADFLGFDTRRDSERIGQMINAARQVAPHAADYDASVRQEWGGFRPMTPDGRPRVGSTPIDGLFLNTGHGTLGWTLACATGHEVASKVSRYFS